MYYVLFGGRWPKETGLLCLGGLSQATPVFRFSTIETPPPGMQVAVGLGGGWCVRFGGEHLVSKKETKRNKVS